MQTEYRPGTAPVNLKDRRVTPEMASAFIREALPLLGLAERAGDLETVNAILRMVQNVKRASLRVAA